MSDDAKYSAYTKHNLKYNYGFENVSSLTTLDILKGVSIFLENHRGDVNDGINPY